jgi:hypothetical protein
LGEFIKAFHVSQDCQVSTGRALASVLVDRLFDLAVLLVVGSSALLVLTPLEQGHALAGLIAGVLAVALAVWAFLSERIFGFFQQHMAGWGRIGSWLFRPDGWLLQLRAGLRQISPPWLIVAGGLAIGANLIFFSQCYLLAIALGLSVSFLNVALTVALGSLVTLVPISISGLGTREAAMIAYMGTFGIAPAQALGFSLLVFVTFYLGGGLIGAVAWWFKPVSLAKLRAI